MPEKINPQIITEAQKGSVMAFETILFRYEKPIYAYAYRLVGHRQDAEDVTQQTFIKFYKNLYRVDPTGDVNSWLYKIATNTAYDWLRKKNRSSELYILEESMAKGWEPASDTDLDRDLEKLELKEDMALAISKIQPKYRSVIILYYYQDFSYHEIAEILSVPLNTVRTYLYRAKLSLKEAVKYYRIFIKS
jgi:RNA polymerase sigma-70 factor (ECF subfamily)